MQKMQKKILSPTTGFEPVTLREKVLPSILLNIAHRIISYILAAQIFDTRKI